MCKKHTHKMHKEIAKYVMSRLNEEDVDYSAVGYDNIVEITTNVSDFPIVDKILDE